MTEAPPHRQSDSSAFSDLLGPPDDLSAAEVRRAREIVFSGMFPRDEGSVVDGRYTLKSTIGAGGIGRVYRAHDGKLDRDVAMKFLRTAPGRQRSTDTLVQEAKVLARLQHPNIVGVFDVGQADGEIYLTMELVTGRSLDRWLEMQQWRWPDIVPLFRQAGAGLAAAHAAGVIHRDFKPSNVMVGDDARVRVVDFGLARAFAQPSTQGQPPEDSSGGSSGGSGLRTSAAGTHQYMAPEQFEGLPSAASDQFGFCTSLFEALTRQRAWSVSGSRGLDGPIARRAVGQRLRKAGVPRWLRTVVLRGLNVAPAERFDDIEALCAALRPPRRWVPAAALAVVAAGSTAVWAAASSDTDVCAARGVRASQMWSPDRRAGVLSRGGASASHEVLVDVIDDYVAAWGSFDLLSCRANEARELSAAALQLRARCLERSLRKISYFLAETRSSPPFSATPEAARGLTSIAECQDDDALLSRTPTPDYDPVVGDALSDAIGRAYVNKTVGNSKVYFDMLEAAEASLRGRGRAIPEELLLDTLYGAELNNRHQYVAAEKLLLPALLRAEAHPDWTAERSRLRAALAAAVSHQPSRAQEGVLLARLSVAAATAIGDGGAHEMAALTALTNAALAADDVDLALAASKRAVGIARQYDGADESPWLSLRLNAAEALGARGHALGEAGQSEAAQDAYLAALAALEALGNRGLLYARIQNNLAALIESSDPSKAEQLLVAAAEIKQRLGLNAEAGLTLMNIGNARVRRGEFESALTAFRHAEAAFQPPTLIGTANLAYNRALALAGLERWQDAEASYRVVLDAADGLRLEDASPLVFSSLLGLGESLLGLNRRLDAGVVFERALVADQEALGPHARAELRLGLSRTVAFDDPTRARAFAREGLAIMPADAAGTELVRRLRVAGSDGESVASAGPTRDSD